MEAQRVPAPRCRVCDGEIELDQLGSPVAAYDPDGQLIHPFGSECHDKAWIEWRNPLTTSNTKLAVNAGYLVARQRPTDKASLGIVVWFRNLTADQVGAADEVRFERRDDGRSWVALRVEGEPLTVTLPPARWLPLDEAPDRLDEWSNLMELDASRALLRQFLTIVRDQSNLSVESTS